MIKCVFFDAFGTLFNVCGLHLQVVETICKELKLNLSLKTLLETWRRQWETIVGKMVSVDKFKTVREVFAESLKATLETYSVKVEDRMVQRYIESLFNLIETKASLNEGTYAVLRWLKAKKIKIGIISNSDINLFRKLVAKFKIRHLLDAVFLSDELKVWKPSEEIFKHALEEVRCKPPMAVMVDDSLQDIIGAKSVGMVTILLLADETIQLNRCYCDYVVPSLKELVPTLMKLKLNV